MSLPPEVVAFLVGLIVLFFTGVFGFLVKKAFNDLAEGVKNLGQKIDTLQLTVAGQNTAIALLNAAHSELTRRVVELERAAS